MKRHYLTMKNKFGSKGFSLLEILIALVIIGILSTIAINRYAERADEAKINAVKSTEKAIADAERNSEIDTGYYVALFALDDKSGIGNVTENGFIQHAIQSEPRIFAYDTSGFLFSGIFPYGQWKGPYINYSGGVDTSGTPDTNSYGAPLDPWGNPYRLYSPAGLFYGTQNDTSYTGVFDRMAVISYGKDGRPGNNNTTVGEGDDIVYKF